MTRVPEEEKKKETPVSRVQMEKEVAAVRQQVHDILAKAQERSEKSGKPLLIMVGENHGNINSALLETIIYQEARALGVKDVAFELPSRGEEGKKCKKEMESSPIMRSTLQGHPLIFQQSRYFGAQAHFVDGRHAAAEKSKDAKLEHRNETIAANLSLISAPTLLCTGALHLRGLNELMKRHNTHEVVCFNVMASNPSSSLDKALEKANKKTPIIGYKPHDLSFASNTLLTEDFLALGMGKTEAQAFLDWAEDNHLRKPKEEIKSSLPHLKKLADTRHHVRDLINYSDALYDLGRDKEAGKYYAQAEIRGKKHPEDKKEEMRLVLEAAVAVSYTKDFYTGAYETIRKHLHLPNHNNKDIAYSPRHTNKEVAKSDWHPPMSASHPAAPPAFRTFGDLLKDFQSPHTGSLPVEDPAHSPQKVHGNLLPAQGIKVQQGARQANPSPKGWSL